MDTVALILRLIVAVTFCIAAAGKALDFKGTKESIANFGAPRWAVGSLSVIIPAAEVFAAILLIPSVTVRYGSILAMLLLLLFFGVIVANLAKGRRPNCNCFGQAYSKPIGWDTIAQNLLLLSCTVIVAWIDIYDTSLGIGKTIYEALNSTPIASALSLIAIGLTVVNGLFLYQILQQNGRLLIRMDTFERHSIDDSFSSNHANLTGLAIHSMAPGFELPSVASGQTVSLDMLKAKKQPIMLVFSDPDCSPCAALWPDIGRWEKQLEESITFVLISRGSRQENTQKLESVDISNILLQKGSEVTELYKVTATPSAQLIGQDGRILSSLVAGPQAIAELVNEQARHSSNTFPLPNFGSQNSTTLRRGDPAPMISATDIHGRTVRLESFVGHDTLLLFWRSSCGYCSEMLGRLLALDADEYYKSTLKLLVVASGDVEETRSLGLSFPVLLDENFYIGYAFGVRGTPSAVLIDAHGNMASEVASGASAIFQLIENNRKSVDDMKVVT